MSKRLRDLTDLVYNSPNYAILQVREGVEPLDLIKLGFRGNETLMRVSKDPSTVTVHVFSNDGPPLSIKRGSEQTVDSELSNMARTVCECVNLDYGIVTNSYAKDFDQLVENTSGYRDLGYARRYRIDVTASGSHVLKVNGQDIATFKDPNLVAKWLDDRGYTAIDPNWEEPAGTNTVEVGYLELQNDRVLERDPYEIAPGSDTQVRSGLGALSEQDKVEINEFLNERPEVFGNTIWLENSTDELLDRVLQVAYDNRQEPQERFEQEIKAVIDEMKQPLINEKVTELAAETMGADDIYPELVNHIKSDYAFKLPYESILETEIKVNLLIESPDGRDANYLALNDILDFLEFGTPNESYEMPDSSFTWLMDAQGYSKDEIMLAYDKLALPYTPHAGDPVVKQMVGEMIALESGAGCLVALASVKLRDLPSLSSGQAHVALPQGASLGIMTLGEKRSGGFGMALEEKLTIPPGMIFDVLVEDAWCRYPTALEAGPIANDLWCRARIGEGETLEQPPLSDAEKQKLNDFLNERPEVNGYVINLSRNEAQEQKLLHAAYQHSGKAPEAFTEAMKREIADVQQELTLDAVSEYTVSAVENIFGDDLFHDVFDHLLESYEFKSPYDDFLESEIDANVMIATSDERHMDCYSIASMRELLVDDGSPTSLKLCDNGMTWLLGEQGYTVEELQGAVSSLIAMGVIYRPAKDDPFLAKAAGEVFTYGKDAGLLTALAKVKVRDLPVIRDANSGIALSSGAVAGLLAGGTGRTGGFGITLNKPVLVPSDMVHDIQVEGAKCNLHTVREACRLPESAWQKPLYIGGSREGLDGRGAPDASLDDLKEKASRQAAEKNASRATASKERKPPELG